VIRAGRRCARTLAIAAVLLIAGSAVAQTPLLITEVPIPAPGGAPISLAAGPDGAMWFTEVSAIGRVDTTGALTQYFLPTAGTFPQSIVVGPDGALWFVDQVSSIVGRITTAGALSEYSIPNPASFILPGPDGALWFAGVNSNTLNFIGRVTTSGAVTTFVASSNINAMTAGPDGALWFTEQSGKIGRITTAGAITEYPLPAAGTRPGAITVGPDGALWFTDGGANSIGRITTSGAITEYLVPTQNSAPFGLTAGPDGAIWFTENPGNYIGRITMAGVITQYPIPTAKITAFGIVTGPDGALWFPEENSIDGISNVGRITTAGVIEEFPAPNSPGSLTAGPDGALWFPDGNNSIGHIALSPTGPLRITSSPAIPFGTMGTPYSWYLTAFGGVPPYTWALVSGALPAGLTLSPDGAISGIPTAAGAQTFTVQLADESSTALTLTLTLGISPPNCTYAPTTGLGLAFSALGGSGSIPVTAPAGCQWTVLNAPSWLTIASGASGSGNGTVNFSAAANASANSLAAVLNVGGSQGFAVSVTVMAGSSGGSFNSNAVVMPHLAAEGGWRTIFTLVNKSLTPTEGQLNLFDNSCCRLRFLDNLRRVR
jgi:virginiamycin B lyase